MTAITAEMLSLDTLTPGAIRTLEDNAIFKPVILEWRKSKHAVAQALSDAWDNDGAFTIDGKTVDKLTVILWATSSLMFQTKNPEYATQVIETPRNATRKSDAWALLKSIQSYRQDILGEKFDTSTAALRKYAEEC